MLSEGNLLFYGDVVADTAIFTSDADALGVIWCLGLRVERCSALRRSIVVIVLGRN